jgi:chromosome partitioning protein
VVLIDCPPSFGTLTLNALTAADQLIIPVQSEFYALKTIGRLIKAARVVGKKFNPNLKLLGFLLTMVDMRTAASREVAEDLRTDLKGKVFDVYIPRNVRLSEVPKLGKPAILFDISSAGVRSYLELAEEVIQKVE